MPCLTNPRNATKVFDACLVFLVLSITTNGADVSFDVLGNAGKDGANTDDNVVGLLDPVHRLNRFNFQQTVLEEHKDAVAHWIVLFCPPWYEPCQALEPVYRELTEKWQEQLNGALLSTEVRFAAVDCASEKGLCNTENVNTYPFVAHYRQQKQVSRWRGKSFAADPHRLRDFLQKELGPVAAALGAAAGLQDSSADLEDVTAESGMDIPVDFLLIFAAIAGNAFFISRGGAASDAPTKQPMGGNALPTPQSEQRSSCVARALPKEWGSERVSIEL